MKIVSFGYKFLKYYTASIINLDITRNMVNILYKYNNSINQLANLVLWYLWNRFRVITIVFVEGRYLDNDKTPSKRWTLTTIFVGLVLTQNKLYADTVSTTPDQTLIAAVQKSTNRNL